MKQDAKKPWSVALGFVLILLILGFIALAFVKLPPLVAPTITGAGAVIVFLLNRRWERTKAIEEEHRKQKIPVYEDFIAFWFKAVLSKPGQLGVTEEEVKQFMQDFTK